MAQFFLDSIAQDIYYIKQTPSCAILAATLFWNSAGHLLHNKKPDLSYFELSYVFWEHNDSVGRGTTVQGNLIFSMIIDSISCKDSNNICMYVVDLMFMVHVKYNLLSCSLNILVKAVLVGSIWKEMHRETKSKDKVNVNNIILPSLD